MGPLEVDASNIGGIKRRSNIEKFDYHAGSTKPPLIVRGPLDSDYLSISQWVETIRSVWSCSDKALSVVHDRRGAFQTCFKHTCKKNIDATTFY